MESGVFDQKLQTRTQFFVTPFCRNDHFYKR